MNYGYYAYNADTDEILYGSVADIASYAQKAAKRGTPYGAWLVQCGDWLRTVGPSVLTCTGYTVSSNQKAINPFLWTPLPFLGPQRDLRGEYRRISCVLDALEQAFHRRGIADNTAAAEYRVYENAAYCLVELVAQHGQPMEFLVTEIS